MYLYVKSDLTLFYFKKRKQDQPLKFIKDK